MKKECHWCGAVGDEEHVCGDREDDPKKEGSKLEKTQSNTSNNTQDVLGSHSTEVYKATILYHMKEPAKP